MTHKIGTIGEFKEWTMQIVKDPAAATNTPKRWFDSEETATKAMETESSMTADRNPAGPGNGASSSEGRRDVASPVASRPINVQ